MMQRSLYRCRAGAHYDYDDNKQHRTYTTPATPANDNVVASEDTFAVYGQGKVSLQPDVAYISLGIRTMNLDS